MREIQQDSFSTCDGQFCPATYSGGGLCVNGTDGLAPLQGVSNNGQANFCPAGYIPNWNDWDEEFKDPCVEAKLSPGK